MKPKGFPSRPFNEAEESEARRAAVLEYADLHNPEARKRILDRANQALKDARALIERLNAMDAKKSAPSHALAKGGKSSKDSPTARRSSAELFPLLRKVCLESRPKLLPSNQARSSSGK
jgi:hypothetical protein